MSAPLLVHRRYAAGALLGRGGQGYVLRVADREAPELSLVAKVWQSASFDASALEAEFSLLRRLDVPGLVRAHDFGCDEQSGAPFLVEDFVEGRAARDFVCEDEGARAERLLHVLAEVAATLSALHDAGFLHGDLKPEHVRVTGAGRVFVLDLGAAVQCEARGAGVAFTPAFAAPELKSGARPSRASDLFALGALGWFLASAQPPEAGRRSLRGLAPWLPPSVSEVIEQLLAPHPRDRPESADDVLCRFGRAALPASRRAVPAPIGRERELAELCRPALGVRYLEGPSGSGKSHLLRELSTRALLAGRTVRRLAFPLDDVALTQRLVAFFRGSEQAFPFREPGPLLLVLDELEAAPLELVTALEAFRCHARATRGLDVVAALRSAPAGASRVTLAPLDDAALASLCRALGITSPERASQLAEVSGRQPGWVVAAAGRVPLTRDMVLERARGLPPGASELLAALALLGGPISEALLSRLFPGPGLARHLAALGAAGLLARRARGAELGYELAVPEVAGEIAAALGSFELSDRLAEALLEIEVVSARTLLGVASAASPPSARARLLALAARRAQEHGAASDEIEALLALGADPSQRTRERVTRLEKLTRHAGSPHPQALAWLAELAQSDRSLRPLVARRQAEAAARAGDLVLARETALAAEREAKALGDPELAALCTATRGAMALYSADVAAADAALRDAAARLALHGVSDAEERARLDHNLGVVSLYCERLDEAIAAFERSLEIKRGLGDRAGVRSCLLNLGLALAKRGRFDDGVRALDEAAALARSLGQAAGRAWCLAARADLEVRRGDARAAERYVAEAEAIREAPPLIAADLCVVRAQAALLDGDGARALAAVASLSRAARDSDALLDARAELVEAGALLAKVPAAPRRAARASLAIVRKARSAKLPEIESQAWALLARARRPAPGAAPRYAGPMSGEQASAMSGEPRLWELLRELGDVELSDAPRMLLTAARALCGAERALLAITTARGDVREAWGVDLDGYELAEAKQRCDGELVRRAAEARATLYLREHPGAAGRGARLAIPRELPGGDWLVVLLLEHRFVVGAFDELPSGLGEQLATLAVLVARLVTAGASPAVAPLGTPPLAADTERGQTTSLPARKARRAFPGMIGSSRALELAVAKLDSAVDSSLPVLLRGETGTGKEMFARALHEHGPRARGAFVAVNCAAIPEALFEAELFGHARGAFTGADRARPGLLARAEGGTLLLDEIGELSLARQAALLRVLETRRYRAVGSDEERPFDVRVICATNRDLEAEVARGEFRSDLLFRINVVEIEVPPLRERREDIPALVQAFLQRSGARLGIAPEAMLALESHDWPGNVRELEHQIQRLSLLGATRIERAHLPRGLRRGSSAPEPATEERAARSNRAPRDEKSEVEAALARSGGNISHAAQALGLTRHGLKKRMLRLGLRQRAEGSER